MHCTSINITIFSVNWIYSQSKILFPHSLCTHIHIFTFYIPTQLSHQDDHIRQCPRFPHFFLLLPAIITVCRYHHRRRHHLPIILQFSHMYLKIFTKKHFFFKKCFYFSFSSVYIFIFGYTNEWEKSIFKVCICACCALALFSWWKMHFVETLLLLLSISIFFTCHARKKHDDDHDHNDT